jgi:anti-sigma factor RsiW
MKEQLESNVITKYAAGLMEHDERTQWEKWLQENPEFANTVAIIQQQVKAMSFEVIGTNPSK